MGSKRKANAPVRWRPCAEAELTAAATLGASLLGGALRSGGTAPPVERNLLSEFKGDAKPQSKSDRAAPSLALSLRVGSEEEETRNRPANATDVLGPGHGDSSHLSLGCGSSGPGRVPQQPVQAAAALPTRSTRLPRPISSRRATSPLLRASAGAPPGSSSAGVGLQVAAGATTARHNCDMCSFYCGLLEAATAEVGVLRAKNVDLRGQVWSLRDELERERRKVGGQQQRQAAPSAGASSLMCRACRCRPGAVVLVNDEYLCLCRRCLPACCGDPSSIAARARAVGADAPR